MFDVTLIESLPRLRQKLATATGPLRHYWQWMQHAARHAPERYAWYQPFCALVTEDPAFLEEARRAVLRFVTQLPAQDCIALVQYHHWAAAAPVGRWGILYDWVAERAPFTAQEHRQIREALLDYGVKHILPALQTKSRRDDNNQVLSLALSATALGWVFGRHGSDPLAEALLDYGLERLHILMDAIPEGGYSGEGSSYMLQIFGPGMVFSAKLLEEITGTPWMKRPASKTGASVEDILRMCAREYTPGGLCLPWDHHGYTPALNFMLPVVLAAETGESQWLDLPRRLGTWSVELNTMWGYDDKVWALLWWPDDPAPAEQSPFMNWMVPEVAGGLIADATALSVVQAWDRCGNTGLSTSRCHVNPNTVLMEAFGSPLTMDGHTAPGSALRFPGCQQVVHYFGTPLESDWSEGALGAHSCLLVDDRADYISATSVTGEGLCLVDLPGLRAVSADATAFYVDGWKDVRRVIRTTILIDDFRILITDRAEFAQAHAVSTRFYLRPQTVCIAGGVRLETPEGVRATFRPVGKPEILLVGVPGFPTTLEVASARVDFRYAPAATHQLATVVDVENTRRDLDLLNEAWWFCADRGKVGVDAGWWRRPTDWWREKPRIPVSDPWVAYGGDPMATVGWYAALFHSEVEARPTHIKLHRTTSAYRAWLDGCALALEGNGLTGWQAVLPADLAPGEHLLVVRTEYDGPGTFWGMPTLQLAQEPTELAALPTILSPGWMRFSDDALLLFDNHEGGHRACKKWRSDARHARLTAPTRWAAADATFVQHSGRLLMNAETPCTLVCNADRITVSGFADGASVTVYLDGALLRLTRAGMLRARLHGAANRQVTLVLTGALASLTVDTGAEAIQVASGEYRLASVSAKQDDLASAATMLALADDPSKDALSGLLAGLTAEVWSVRSAAAWGLARRGEAVAVPALLTALSRENPAEIYPEPAEVDVEVLVFIADPRVPTGEAPASERIGKRWRVRMQIIESLGLLRDPRAVPELSAILASCTEPYPVLAAAARALGRIGDPSVIPVVAKTCIYYEACTHLAARDAYRALTGRAWRTDEAQAIN